MRKLGIILLSNIITLSMIAGCSQGEQAAQSKNDTGTVESGKKETAKVNEEPVTLNLFAGQDLSDDLWNLLLHEPLKKKYPYITVNIVKKGKGIQDLVAGGANFDLYTEFQGYLGNLIQVGLLEDITPYAKKNNIDLNRFDPIYINALKEYSDKGEVYGLPYYRQANALYYNKDIFDKFGVPYPTDGMTWEDTIELARKVTRQDGGIQYYGLDPEHATRLAFPLSLVILNGKTNKAEINNDQWRKVFQVAQSMYSIPGNIPKKTTDLNGGGIVRFMTDRNIAMLATINIIDRLKDASTNGLNWDMVQYPSYSGMPNVYGMVDFAVIGATKTSKNKDAAMKVIEVFTSDEVQLLASRKRPVPSPLVNPEMKTQFAADIPYAQGKNIPAFFKSTPAPAPRFSDYYTNGRDILNKYYDDFVLGKKDMNTALREAEEELNQKIGELSKK
ncbi:ABC transporter substrate-binding protein [Paenibacillus sp. UNC451MF]|uniref:ABC transporter substrate-binding protein n=1 Tax=Paenibacillus sp. UNC451MF TaxID=1449063 RepID=UPI00048C2095|nr:extracellular solute-binding protein [Paenibacillus sp. UNC451MF]